MSGVPGAGQTVIDEVASWPGTEAAEGSRGELSLRLGKREIGHLHGDHALHLGFPRAVWHRLHDEGRIDYHPVFPGKPGYSGRGDRERRGRSGRDRAPAGINYDNGGGSGTACRRR